MARIDEFLAKILSSRYGRDVRDAIHDSIEEINNINEANISTVQAIANTAQGYANNASDSADTAEQAVTDAQAQVTLANTARTGAETAEDGAEHFYQETLAIAQNIGKVITPKGTVAFADLPSVSSTAIQEGFMYNISDAFTTTSDFVEGAGVSIPMGANVYKLVVNNTSKWDILAGSSAQVFTGTEAQIAAAEQAGLLSEGVMINSLDDGADPDLTSSMILHNGDSVENKLDDIDDEISEINASLTVTTLVNHDYTNHKCLIRKYGKIACVYLYVKNNFTVTPYTQVIESIGETLAANEFSIVDAIHSGGTVLTVRNNGDIVANSAELVANATYTATILLQ